MTSRDIIDQTTIMQKVRPKGFGKADGPSPSDQTGGSLT